MRSPSKLFRDTKGAVSVEYALVACLISIAAIGGYSALGTKVHAYYGSIDNRVSQHM